MKPKTKTPAAPQATAPATATGPAPAPHAGTDWDKVAALRPVLPKIPDHAFTTREYAKKFDLSLGMATAELEKLRAAGKLQTAMSTGSRRAGAAGHPERMYWPV